MKFQDMASVSKVPVDHSAAQHGFNAIAISAAPVTIWVHAPEIVTVVAGVLGAVWYLIIITEKILGWINKEKPEDPDDPPEIPHSHKH